MDMPSSWLQEQLEMQDQGYMNQYQMNKPYYYNPMEEFSVDSFSSDSYTETPSFADQSFQNHKSCLPEPFNFKKADGIKKKTDKSKQKLVSDSPNSFTISFGDITPKDELLSFGDTYGFAPTGKKKAPATIRSPVQVQDHVLAERKRREKLAQRFISLSSLLPDLKKMDKATVLEDAASYIQELETRVKELERKKTQDSVITGKRSRLSSSDDNGSSSNEANFEESSSPCNPEIEVRTSGCNLLVEIYSRKNGISLVKVLSEMQKFGLSIISCSTMPFADTTLLVTIVAQKSDDFNMSSTDLVKNLEVVV
ncbi:transcription factor bHLH18-like [Bidens hawaiensis]|uniref:transcription factor bHLH18-like n=1 Tax=Bidens hawaiensis TaxID=980011 RepID=UPI00404A2373